MRVRVFIACSKTAVPLAEALRNHLNAMTHDGNVDPARPTVLWTVSEWWLRTQGLGDPILKMLQDECQVANLAVTLLTGDDLKLTGGTVVVAARDNCIFEAGLFMGALGVESNRSVLVSSLDQLPGDLQGVKYLKMPEATPENLLSEDWCRDTMRQVAADLRDHAWSKLRQPAKRPVLEVLSADELFERERLVSDGGDLQPGIDSVVVNTLQPAEENSIPRARQVVRNMEAGVRYLYFFRADRTHVPKVIRLLESLVIALLPMDTPVPTDDAERAEIIRQNRHAVPSMIKKIQPYLFIHFLPNERAPLLFCVHNAGNVTHATCYLRDGTREQFYRWGNQQTAFDVARDLRRFQGRENDPAVFYPTELFKLYDRDGDDVRTELVHHLQSTFGGSKKLARQIKKVCFLSQGTAKAIEMSPEPLPSIAAARSQSI